MPAAKSSLTIWFPIARSKMFPWAIFPNAIVAFAIFALVIAASPIFAVPIVPSRMSATSMYTCPSFTMNGTTRGSSRSMPVQPGGTTANRFATT